MVFLACGTAIHLLPLYEELFLPQIFPLLPINMILLFWPSLPPVTLFISCIYSFHLPCNHPAFPGDFLVFISIHEFSCCWDQPDVSSNKVFLPPTCCWLKWYLKDDVWNRQVAGLLLVQIIILTDSRKSQTLQIVPFFAAPAKPLLFSVWIPQGVAVIIACFWALLMVESCLPLHWMNTPTWIVRSCTSQKYLSVPFGLAHNRNKPKCFTHWQKYSTTALCCRLSSIKAVTSTGAICANFVVAPWSAHFLNQGHHHTPSKFSMLTMSWALEAHSSCFAMMSTYLEYPSEFWCCPLWN